MSPACGAASEFTGQRLDATGLYFYNARYYDPVLGRFVSADTIVPDWQNPQAWNRYSYVVNNPLKYTDPSDHCPWCLVIAAAVVVSKAVDWGWTAWDAWQATNTLADPKASAEAKGRAQTELAAIAAFELLEPDELLPLALPLDDVGRRIAKGAGREAAGQTHHLLSKTVIGALEKHETLRGVFNPQDFLAKAADLGSHQGYQSWHRAADEAIESWLTEHKTATPGEFLDFLRGFYSSEDMRQRFPEASEMLADMLRQWLADGGT